MTTYYYPHAAVIYNPQNQSKAQLMEGFVVRQKLFRRLFMTIKESEMEVPEQHYLLLGQHGMGKTTLLMRLAYEVENDAALAPWLLPLIFNEEEYGARRLFNFWERIMELIGQQYPSLSFNKEERRRLSSQHKDDDAYERALFNQLTEQLRSAGKKIILFVDNFGSIIRRWSDAEAHRLRKILQTSADLRVFAASAAAQESFFHYDHPFYEFFKVVELKGLDEEETRALLRHFSESYKKEHVTYLLARYPGRIEALRRITGGTIRTLVLLFEAFADDREGNAFKNLEAVLDRVTPLYKHRMDDLSSQQQSIVEAIALNWDALSVKEIAEHTRLESKVISAQLQSLEKSGIIQKIPTRTKNHLYIVAERFFNIWYLMRNSRPGNSERIHWLLRFLEDWCSREATMEEKERKGTGRSAQKGMVEEAAATYHTSKCHESLWRFDFGSPAEAISFLKARKFDQAETHELMGYFMQMMAADKAAWLLQLIHSDEGEAAQLKSRLKPIYYALLKKLDHPDFLRMGEELAETVDEVLAQVEARKKAAI